MDKILTNKFSKQKQSNVSSGKLSPTNLAVEIAEKSAKTKPMLVSGSGLKF